MQTSSDSSTDVDPAEQTRRQETYALTVYILQALSFLVPLTAVAGVVINYLKLTEVQGIWLESHFRWQLRTFWWGLLGSIIAAVLTIILIGWLLWAAVVVWVIYRIVVGWLALQDKQPAPQSRL